MCSSRYCNYSYIPCNFTHVRPRKYITLYRYVLYKNVLTTLLTWYCYTQQCSVECAKKLPDSGALLWQGKNGFDKEIPPAPPPPPPPPVNPFLRVLVLTTSPSSSSLSSELLKGVLGSSESSLFVSFES